MNQVRSIKNINKFHNPTNNFLDRDMALIELDSPFAFNQYVSPVCLPTRNPAVNDYCVVVGWGNTQGKLTKQFAVHTIWSLMKTIKLFR